jgi:hypothetical protein
MSERFIEADVVEALKRLRAERGPVGPLLDVHFAVADLPRDVLHGLGVVPTGYAIECEQGGHAKAWAMVTWTPTVALLVADTNDTRIKIRFLRNDEVPRVA